MFKQIISSIVKNMLSEKKREEIKKKGMHPNILSTPAEKTIPTEKTLYQDEF